MCAWVSPNHIREVGSNVANTSVIPSFGKVQLRLVEVLEPLPGSSRVRVGFMDPGGSLHFAVLEFRLQPGGEWEWEVVNDHCVQLGLVGCNG